MLTGSVERHTPVKRDPEFLCETTVKCCAEFQKSKLVLLGTKTTKAGLYCKICEIFILDSADVIMFDYFNTASLEYR